MITRPAIVPGALHVADTANHTPAPATDGVSPNPAVPDSPPTQTAPVKAQAPWASITALADTVFATLTASNWNGGTQQTNVALPAGATIYGNFTQFQLTSGEVVAYFAH